MKTIDSTYNDRWSSDMDSPYAEHMEEKLDMLRFKINEIVEWINELGEPKEYE